MLDLFGQQAIEVGEFLGGRRPALREDPRGADLGVGIFWVFLGDAGGEIFGAFDDELVIHQEERLRGDRGEVAAFAVRIHIREVERGERRGRAAATLLEVDRAAVDRGG